MSVYKDKGEPMRLSDAFAYRRAFRFWIATAKGHKAAYAAMRQRAERAEASAAEEEKACEKAIQERDELDDILGNIAACFDQEFSSSYGPEDIEHDIRELQENRDIWQSEAEGMEKRAREAIARAERAEESLRDFVSILSIPHPVESGTYRELLTTAFGRAKELLGVVPDPGASPPADASTMGGEREPMNAALQESWDKMAGIQWSEPGTPMIDRTTGKMTVVPNISERERRLVDLVRDAFMQGWDANDSDYPYGGFSYSERAEEAWERSTARAALAEMEQKS